MNYDALTTAAVRDELIDKIEGGRVQKILLPSEDSLALEVYAKQQTHWLLASIHPQHARVHLIPHKLHRMVETESPLLLLLRKYARDGRLTKIEQLPFERVLILTFSKMIASAIDIEEQPTDHRLIIEIMGRYSNIILVDEQDRILECAKRVYPHMNRYRTILPNYQYTPPPPQDKHLPSEATAFSLSGIIHNAPGNKPLHQLMVESFRAVSPLLAKEIVYRSTGTTSFPAKDVASTPNALESLSANLKVLFAPLRTHQWPSSAATVDSVVVAYAPYLLTHLPDYRDASSISEAIAAFYENPERTTSHPLQKARLHALINDERERLLRKRQSLEQGLQRAAEADRLRQSGQLILTYIGQIGRGQRTLEIDGTTIELDPLLSPAENAQAYFRDYNKAKAAHQEVPILLNETEMALTYLAQTSQLVEMATDTRTLASIQDELAEAGFGKTPQKERPKVKKKTLNRQKQAAKPRYMPMKLQVQKFDVFVGRSGRENDELTFHLGTGEDLWFHARGIPGAHVLLKVNGRTPNPSVLEQTAAIAATNSQARLDDSVAVDYTERKNVRKVKGAPPGLVTYSGETTLKVKPSR